MTHPSLDLQLTWRGSFGRVRVWASHVAAETSFERDEIITVPMCDTVGWRIEPCDFEAVCVEFVTANDVFRVLLDPQDEPVVRTALTRVLGTPLPSAEPAQS